MLVPRLGITGSALATVIGSAFLAALMLITLKQKMPQLALGKQVNWRALLLAITGMVAFLAGMDWLMEPIISRAGLLLYVLFISVTGGAVYLLLLLRQGAFRKTDLSMLPLAGLWIRLHKERDS